MNSGPAAVPLVHPLPAAGPRGRSRRAWGQRPLVRALVMALALCGPRAIRAAEGVERRSTRDALSEQEWRQIERAVDRGLAWLAKKQRPDGSFDGTDLNEPGISGLCVLAFLSRGHVPGQGPYGRKLDKAVEYILESQQADGLVSRNRQRMHAPYCHGIGSLVLSEVYGMGPRDDDRKLKAAIEKSLVFAGRRLSQPKYSPDDEGSWRYLARFAISDGDLSVTSWHVMFLRSARNAGFEVDVKLIDDAIAYIHRLYDPERRTFRYEIHTDDPEFNHTRGMAGAGVLALALAGEHKSPDALRAARFILERPFNQYDHPIAGEQYQCYSAFYCSQGMFQLGGDSWKEFYRELARTLVSAQREQGSWRPNAGGDVRFGEPYMTALSILALSPPFQMLPIFQK